MSGALILVETSGWFKIVYFDTLSRMRGNRGRYPTSPPLALIDATTDDVADNQ
jgi:hypothetical protein